MAGWMPSLIVACGDQRCKDEQESWRWGIDRYTEIYKQCKVFRYSPLSIGSLFTFREEYHTDFDKHYFNYFTVSLESSELHRFETS